MSAVEPAFGETMRVQRAPDPRSVRLLARAREQVAYRPRVRRFPRDLERPRRIATHEPEINCRGRALPCRDWRVLMPSAPGAAEPLADKVAWLVTTAYNGARSWPSCVSSRRRVDPHWRPAAWPAVRSS